MTLALQRTSHTEQPPEMQELLSSYWGRDCWELAEPFFDPWRATLGPTPVKKINFSALPEGVRDEFKFLLAARLVRREMRLGTSIKYGICFRRLADFLKRSHPTLSSLKDLSVEKALLQWRSYLIEQGARLTEQGHLSTRQFEHVFRQAICFVQAAYDSREEFEKEVWDLRKIPGAQITNTSSAYLLRFTGIPEPFRPLVKRYITMRIARQISVHQCYKEVRALQLFLCFLQQPHPTWQDLVALSREDMEKYLTWYRGHSKDWKNPAVYLYALRGFLRYIQRAEYPEAPEKPAILLLMKEDIPGEAKPEEESIKYIPEDVLQQLETHLEHLTPPKYIPMIILLRASGWRIADVLNLRYDTCLTRTDLGWYLCGDINKTRVLNHRIPITNEVAAIIQAVVEETKEKSTSDNNPDRLLFVRFEGRRKGRPPKGETISRALNRLAKRYKIVDRQEQLFHFGNHAFRHTKAVELINNGMSLVHVQKWLAHYSPEMTLRYARILDATMREEWERVARQGLFRFDRSGKPTRVQLADIANEDLVEWEYIRTHLDAVRVPLGYCLKPLTQPCGTQLNPCLTCSWLCTTAEFLPEFEHHLEETQKMIDRSKALGRKVWVEKNQVTFIRLENVARVLREGKTHHKLGKQWRESRGGEQPHAEHS
jgi:integrase